MPPTLSAQSIYDSLFGCCLGGRRAASARNDNRTRGGGSRVGAAGEGQDERTPLLSGQQAGRGGNGHGGGGARGGAAGQRNGFLLGSRHVGGGLQAGTSEAGAASGSSPGGGVSKQAQQAAGEKAKRKKDVDAARLKAIRDQAQAAFFTIDSSQLLPSSSSLAQRQASMGTSQRLNRRDQFRDRANDEGQSYAAVQQKETIAASDKAERLYKAAMKANHSRALVSEVDEDDDERHEGAVPIGLVRQVRLSVRDVKAKAVDAKPRGRSAGSAQNKFSSGSAATARARTTQSRDDNGTLAPLEEVESRRGSGSQLSKLPSIHSLRTLRLGVVQPLHSTATDEEDHDVALSAGHSVQSTVTDGGGGHRSLSEPTTDDERWERRGRTRSSRGLMWMDKESKMAEAASEGGGEGKRRLKEMWKEEGKEGEAATDDEGNGSAADEIQYGLRFEIKHADKRRELDEKLKQAAKQPLAVMWDESGEA